MLMIQLAVKSHVADAEPMGGAARTALLGLRISES